MRGQVGGIVEGSRSPPSLVDLSTTSETFSSECAELFKASAMGQTVGSATLATGHAR